MSLLFGVVALLARHGRRHGALLPAELERGGFDEVRPARAPGRFDRAQSVSPARRQVVVFEANLGNVSCYRIPSVVQTPSGALLAFAEARHDAGCGDDG